jgi:hypothetical protein
MMIRKPNLPVVFIDPLLGNLGVGNHGLLGSGGIVYDHAVSLHVVKVYDVRQLREE